MRLSLQKSLKISLVEVAAKETAVKGTAVKEAEAKEAAAKELITAKETVTRTLYPKIAPSHPIELNRTRQTLVLKTLKTGKMTVRGLILQNAS